MKRLKRVMVLAGIMLGLLAAGGAQAMSQLSTADMERVRGGIWSQCNLAGHCANYTCIYVAKYGWYANYLPIYHAVCGPAGSGICIMGFGYECSRETFYWDSRCTDFRNYTEYYTTNMGCNP